MELIEIISLIAISSILIGLALNRLFSKKIDFEISLFQSYIAGLIAIYLLVLTGLPLNVLIKVLIYFSVISFIYFIYYFSKLNKIKIAPLHVVFIFIISIVAVYFTKEMLHAIVYQPIFTWDARSIWYIKAKQLFFSNGLNPDTGINMQNGLFFSHPEYPFLVPALGALLAKYVGYWNEYLPKSNLLLLWIGVVLAFYSLKNMHIISKTVIFISLFIISPYFIANGYMDVWLGIYAALSILFLIEYVQHFRGEYLLSSLCCILFCNYIKQDAMLITVSIWSSFILLLLLTKNKRFIKYTTFKLVKILPLLLILLLPFLFWAYYKNKWNLSATDFDFGKLADFENYKMTFSRVKLNLIYNNFVYPVRFLKIFFIISLVVISGILYAKFSKVARPMMQYRILSSIFPLLAAVIFAASMHILYCLSRIDLSLHLDTSANRLRLDLLFISLPALYSAGGFFFYFPYKIARVPRKRKKRTKTSKTRKIKKR